MLESQEDTAAEEISDSSILPDVELPEAQIPSAGVDNDLVDVPEAETPSAEVETPSVDTVDPTDVGDNDSDEGNNSNNSSSGNPEGFEWGNGNGEVPPGKNVDEDGNIINNGGHMPPGLNRRNKNKPDKDENPNPPDVPEDPGTEDSSDKNANKAQQGTHIYTYNGLFVRINNTQTTHSGSVYSRDYVIDYTSIERSDLMVYAEGNGQLDYVRG